MKSLISVLVFFPFLIFGSSTPNNKVPYEVKKESSIEKVNLFLKGAQVDRSTEINLRKGTYYIRLIDLSPYIESNSIQIKANRNARIMAIRYEKNYLDEHKNEMLIDSLNLLLEACRDSLETTHALISVAKDDILFIKTNQKLSKLENVMDVKNISSYYSDRLKALKLQEISLNNKKLLFENKANLIQSQLNNLGYTRQQASGEIVIEIEAHEDGLHKLSFNYYSQRAFWIPQYDIRCKNISSPLEIFYRANIKQEMGEDWNNVPLTLSTENPLTSKNFNSLRPYYISYKTYPPRYNTSHKLVSGVVIGESGEPLIGANVLIDGSTIGTITDIEGRFELSLQDGNQFIRVSYIGYNDKVLRAQSGLNVIELSGGEMLSELVVIDGVPAGASTYSARKIKNQKKDYSIDFSKQNFKFQVTGYEYILEEKVSLKSGEKHKTVNINQYMVNPKYQYVSAPKVNPAVFLHAHIIDWSIEGLLDGQANLYFNDTYIGKSVFNVASENDSIFLSLGIDESLKVSRRKLSESVKKPLLSGKKTVFRDWELLASNNKSIPVEILIYDQIPVSTDKDIKVEFENKSMAHLDEKTGILTWTKKIQAKSEQTIQFSYKVKHSNKKTLYVD